MKYLSITLITQSPLSIRSDHASEGAQMTNYIPSTTLIGALASTYKLMYPEESASFERLFLSGAVSFPHLYPATHKRYQTLPAIDENLPIYPIPKTALTCKRHKGFRFPEEADNEGHGVRDTLIPRAIFNEWIDDPHPHRSGYANWNSEAKVQSLVALEDIKQCFICKEPTNRFDGYYRRIAQQRLPMLASETYTHLQTHTGINRLSGVVEEGILYNRQVFNAGTQFWGLLHITDEKSATELKAFLAEISDMNVLRIGTGRTRGMGNVRLFVKEVDKRQEAFTDFQQRLHAFQLLLQDKAAYYQRLHMAENYYFALTLHSPAILNDELLRYQSIIDENTLKSLLPTLPVGDLAGLEPVYQQASTQRITGWQELWGTPRMNEYAIEAGSVFLFKYPIAQRDQLIEALYKLEEQGIGKRRLEGFGRIHISDAFHQEDLWQ